MLSTLGVSACFFLVTSPPSEGAFRGSNIDARQDTKERISLLTNNLSSKPQSSLATLQTKTRVEPDENEIVTVGGRKLGSIYGFTDGSEPYIRGDANEVEEPLSPCKLHPNDDPCVVGCGNGVILNPWRDPIEASKANDYKPAPCMEYGCICADSGCLLSWQEGCVAEYMSCQQTQICGDISSQPTSISSYNFGSCPDYTRFLAPTPECVAPIHRPPTSPPTRVPISGDDDDDDGDDDDDDDGYGDDDDDSSSGKKVGKKGGKKGDDDDIAGYHNKRVRTGGKKSGKKGGKKGGYYNYYDDYSYGGGDDDDDDDDDDSGVPTPHPTPVPTSAPTPIPTATPTGVPTAIPTRVPTATPTPFPTPQSGAGKPTPGKPVPSKPVPSKPIPSKPAPTSMPTQYPSPRPTPPPTLFPTPSPTLFPTSRPTSAPTQPPIPVPTPAPTQLPTPQPTPLPPRPTSAPTLIPTLAATSGIAASTPVPFHTPTAVPTPVAPTPVLFAAPTTAPRPVPTGCPEGEYQCDFQAKLTFQCGPAVFVCNDEPLPIRGMGARTSGIDVTGLNVKICAENLDGGVMVVQSCTDYDTCISTYPALGSSNYQPASGCACANMIAGVQGGSISANVMCPNGQFVSSFSCYKDICANQVCVGETAPVFDILINC